MKPHPPDLVPGDSARQRRTARGVRHGFGVLIALLLAAGPLWAAEGPTESQVKAAFIFHLAKFVEWPAHRFAAADAPLVVAVLGSEAVCTELGGIVRDRRINGHPVQVRNTVTAHGDAVHLVFLGAGEERRLPEVAGPGVLTVGETPRFQSDGGLLTLAAPERKLCFDLNLAGTEAAGLKISAQLLKLARQVNRSR